MTPLMLIISYFLLGYLIFVSKIGWDEIRLIFEKYFRDTDRLMVGHK